MEKLVDVNWEESGLLKDLDENHKKTMIELLNKVGPEFKNHYFHNERMENYLFPCMRRIYSKLFVENESPNVSIDDIDIKYIMTEIDRLYPYILLLKQNLPKIDVEAELTEMFCTNYTKIIEPKKYKDYLKVRKESEDEFGDKLCYCGHTSKCSCADPGVSEFNSGVRMGAIKIDNKDNLNGVVFEFDDDFKQIIKEQEEKSKNQVKYIYPEKYKLFDLVVLESFWDAYYIKKPEVGNMIDDKVITEISNDGVAYFINFKKD